MSSFSENKLAQKITEIIQSQQPIHVGSSIQSKSQGQSVAVRLNQRVTGSPSVVRAIAFTPVQPGTRNVNLIRLSKPINGVEWAAFSTNVNQSRGFNSEVVVTQVPAPPSGTKKLEIKINIGYTGRL